MSVAAVRISNPEQHSPISSSYSTTNAGEVARVRCLPETAAVFGPSRTTVSDGVANRIHVLVSLDGLQDGDYLFHLANDRRSPLAPSTWTEFVQDTFKLYSARGVALSPKDCRASFITHMRDGDHDDETLRAAALAMRHSSQMAASATYDKHGSDRVVARAMEVADAFASKYALVQ